MNKDHNPTLIHQDPVTLLRPLLHTKHIHTLFIVVFDMLIMFIVVFCCVQLSRLPAEIGQLKRLRVLFAYRNRLSDVPEELGACTQLEVNTSELF